MSVLTYSPVSLFSLFVKNLLACIEIITISSDFFQENLLQ